MSFDWSCYFHHCCDDFWFVSVLQWCKTDINVSKDC